MNIAQPEWVNNSPQFFRGMTGLTGLQGTTEGNVGIGTRSPLPAETFALTYSDAPLNLTTEVHSTVERLERAIGIGSTESYFSIGPVTPALSASSQDISFLNTQQDPILRVTPNAVKRCPIHGTTVETMGFNFPDIGVDETYCLRCLRDLLRRQLTPIDGMGAPPSVPAEPGVTFSRYDLLKKQEGKGD